MNKPFFHPQSLCESANIGNGTRVWAFAHILPKAVIGQDCNICDHVFIENDVVVGDRVTVKCGVQLWDGVRVENDVFIGPNATFTNDKFPRSRAYQEKLPTTVVETGASIGANATILPGITIGMRAMVGAGAVVTRNVPPRAVVMGNPARITGYVDTPMHSARQREPNVSGEPVVAADVPGVTIHTLKQVSDLRGDLSVGEFSQDIPFVPARYFLVYGVPTSKIRGEHAHKVCHQFMICVRGSLAVIADDGTTSQEFNLDRPNMGLYMPPCIWGVQYKYSPDAVLLVFASHAYDASDYLRKYEEFLHHVASTKTTPHLRLPEAA
ncbi:MAG: WxcM-like domain-containing protein [Gemmataceae bacterium]|jgi:acetyltransferase-like isoleucine patch superfamily enzyme